MLNRLLTNGVTPVTAAFFLCVALFQINAFGQITDDDKITDADRVNHYQLEGDPDVIDGTDVTEYYDVFYDKEHVKVSRLFRREYKFSNGGSKKEVFDENGNVVDQIWKHKDGKTFMAVNSEFDDNGNRTHESWSIYEPDGSRIEHQGYYDSNGKALSYRRFAYDKDGMQIKEATPTPTPEEYIPALPPPNVVTGTGKASEPQTEEKLKTDTAKPEEKAKSLESLLPGTATPTPNRSSQRPLTE